LNKFPADSADPIRSDEAYTVEQFTERTGVGRASIRHAELNGLRSCFVAKKKFIRGAAWLVFLKKCENEQRGRRPPRVDDDRDAPAAPPD
jgi:hypothetical protein